MKKSALFLLLAATITIIGCKRETVNIEAFEGNEWYSDSILVIRNDSSVSFSEYDSVYEQLVSPKALPLQLTDSTMIFSRYEVAGSYDSVRKFHPSGCVLVTDTVKYDIKYINKRPKLIIYIDPFPVILSSRNRINVEETNNFNPVKFEISNFSIGDQIDRSLLKTLGVYNYANYTIEDCEYINDKNISFKIIGYNNIFSIERRKIEDYRVKDIMKVVTSKLNNAPGYSPMRQWSEDSDYEYEFYRWETNGVRIDLSRSHYIGNDSYKTLLNNRNWNLSYDDVVLQAILVETYKNGNPTSSIIN
ncbi:MAG: hypothetical protein MJ069_00580 [Salinivirgaceae bacterium]|nr:hypothetical protein [Salinivirgaceae bacterium]